MTPSEIDPATFRFVAHCLNYYATTCPLIDLYKKKNAIERNELNI
jgi:hypothetical protein